MTENKTYTTGELAAGCGATVRTVQYYDQKGLLSPSGYSEGGRRLYNDTDVARLRFILLLKALGLKLSQIDGILKSPNREAILSALLVERSFQIEEEIAEQTGILDAIKLMQTDLELYGKITTTSQAAMENRMNDRKSLSQWKIVMIIVGIIMDVAWIGTLVYGIVTGIWWPFPLALAFVAVAGVFLVVRTNSHVTYLCPVCEAEFRPKLGAFFIAGHTPTTRKLTCPCCHTKDWCIERYHAHIVSLAPGECMPGTCKLNACYAEDNVQ